MIYLDLIFNLALLVALSVVSGFIDRRWRRETRLGVFLQGVLFGGAAVLGMLRPFNLGPGLIFDGRSVMVSLCAFFFGPWSAAVAGLMTMTCRVAIGGVGTLTGVMVILASAGIGLVAYFRINPAKKAPSMIYLYLLGLVVHVAMLALMFTLPPGVGINVVKKIGLPVICLYPLAMILIGKILADQVVAVQSEAVLREKQQRLAYIIEGTNAGTWEWNIQTGETIFNERWADILGYTLAEISPVSIETWAKFAHPDDFKKSGELLARHFSGELDNYAIEVRMRHKDGRWVWVLDRGKVSSWTKEGKPLLMQGTHQDITERRRAEEALKESYNYLEKLNNALVDAIFVVKYPERSIEYLNEAAVKMFGYSKQEVLGKNSRMFYPDQEAYFRSGGIFQDAIENKQNLVRFEVVLLRNNGDTFPGWLTATFLQEEVVTKFIVIVQDITEQKRDNETIRRLNIELEQRVAERTNELSKTQLALLNLVDDLNESARNLTASNASLSTVNKELEAFSYSVSHDLRSPLRSIDGFSQALLEDYSERLDDTGRNFLTRIRKATQHMGRLIDDMLKLSRVTRADFQRMNFDLSALVENIVQRMRKNSPERIVDVRIQAGLSVSADRNLMEIALVNLLDNAWKFTGKTAHVQIEFGAVIANGKPVFFIRDNGAGFDRAYGNKLFGTFQRLHTTEEFEGTGIGLATVRRIITRHGGEVWAEGDVGRGATLFFTVP